MAFDKETCMRFRQFRKKYLGTQKEAAELLGVTQKHITNIETGQVGIGMEMVRVLVRKKKMNANWFITGTGNLVTDLPDQRKLIHDVSDLRADIDLIFSAISSMESNIKLLSKALGKAK